MDEFVKELEELLKKHNATIEWTCGPCSDMCGIYDDHLVLNIENQNYELRDSYVNAGNIHCKYKE